MNKRATINKIVEDLFSNPLCTSSVFHVFMHVEVAKFDFTGIFSF